MDPLLWFMGCRVPTLDPESTSRSPTPHPYPCLAGIPVLSLGSNRVAPCKVAIRQRIARSGASPVHHRITSRNVGPNHHFPRGLVAVLSPPPAIWRHRSGVLKRGRGRPPVARVSPGDLRDFPWSLQHRLADAIIQGSAKAGEPKCREEHSPSPRNLAMSCRSEATKTTRCTVGKSPAMRCRSAPPLALT